MGDCSDKRGNQWVGIEYTATSRCTKLFGLGSKGRKERQRDSMKKEGTDRVSKTVVVESFCTTPMLILTFMRFCHYHGGQFLQYKWCETQVANVRPPSLKKLCDVVENGGRPSALGGKGGASKREICTRSSCVA